MASENASFISYKNNNTVVAETVYQFIYGMLYGAAWGCVTPFPAPGSAAAIAEAATGIFKPVPPFGAILTGSIPSNAIYFGTILGVQRCCCKSMELLRRTEDIGNDIFGFAMIYPYYHYFLNHSERRLIRHNRIVGGTVICCVLYANLLA